MVPLRLGHVEHVHAKMDRVDRSLRCVNARRRAPLDPRGNALLEVVHDRARRL
ncbi:MAG: hypothetical protein KBB21_06565 [Nannocystaceae bacterium]|nr:hypothetical protein [Nannocystaceae bacterium]